MKCLLDYFEENVKKYGHKKIFIDINQYVTYSKFKTNAKRVGSNFTDFSNKPVVIFMDKGIDLITTMMGVVYSGNFYTVIDSKMPLERAKIIIDVLKPQVIITKDKDKEKINGHVMTYETLLKTSINNKKLNDIRSKIIDTNPMYVLFTSGSTGVPKGVVVSHKAVISYLSWFTKCFNINSETVFGNQTPFYFSMSVSDVLGTIFSGATLNIIPKMYFSFPIKLLEYMNKSKINTIYWVPSALCILANFKALGEIHLKSLKKVLFAGEVMPTKQLNEWIKYYPNCEFANLFGPTETTDICSYFVINRKLKNEDVIPIGKPCDNCSCMVIKDGHLVGQNDVGELYVKGSFLANGYYGNPQKTSEVFVQNPLNNAYLEVVYKTGDLVTYNKRGELIYVGRKDFQIKHMGYRIELGEIESKLNLIDGITSVVCVYHDNKIIAYYTGKINEDTVIKQASLKLTDYMCPNKIVKLDKMIYNMNGKIDRNYFNNLVRS